jgi:hypothetical protein
MMSTTDYVFINKPIDKDICYQIAEKYLLKDNCFGKDKEILGFDGSDSTLDFYSIMQGQEHLFITTMKQIGFIHKEVHQDIEHYQIVLTYAEDSEITPYFSHSYNSKDCYCKILANDDAIMYIQQKNKTEHIEKLTSLAKMQYAKPTDFGQVFGSIFAGIGAKDYLGAEPKTLDELNSLYKAKSKLLHPDVNKSEHATLEFQALQGVYSYFKSKIISEQSINIKSHLKVVV